MKRIFLIVCCSLIWTAESVFAVPAHPRWQQWVQPDSSVVELQLAGDEFAHFWRNRAGEMMVQDSNGYWHRTETIPVSYVAARPAPVRSTPTQSVASAPITKGIVLLVNYKDIQMNSINTRAAFDSMMMVDTYKYNPTYPGSARKYFRDQSNGKFVPQFDVYGPVTLDSNRVYYGGNKPSKDYHAVDMIAEACKKADALIDYSQYDQNSDGKVDFVFVIYAGVGEAESYVEESVWPHKWQLSSKGKSVTLDGKKVDLYACTSELNYLYQRAGIATFCHEFSHVVGLPDYYDVNYGTNYNNGLTPLDWSLMDVGTYCGDGYCPPNYSIFDKYYLGWAAPSILCSPQNVTLTTDYTAGYQINSKGVLLPYSSTDTVYYIENRQNKGWDKGLLGHGMLLWKVMYNKSAWDNNSPNATSGKVRYELVCADGGHTKIDGYWYADSGDSYPGTKKVLNINSKSPFIHYPITDINESSGLITFRFMGGTPDSCTYYVDAENCQVSSSDGKIAFGDTLRITLTPDEGYEIDSTCILGSMGERDLTYGVDWFYTDGVLVIPDVENEIEVLVIPNLSVSTEIERGAATLRVAKKLLRGELRIFRNGVIYSVMGNKL